MIDGEEYLTNKRVRLIELKPNRAGERALMLSMKARKVDSLKVVWSERTGRMRIVIPEIVPDRKKGSVPDGPVEPRDAE